MLMKFFLKYKSMGRNIIKKIFSTPKSPKPLIYKNIKKIYFLILEDKFFCIKNRKMTIINNEIL